MNGRKNGGKSVPLNIDSKTSLIIVNKGCDCKTNVVLCEGEKFQKKVLEGSKTNKGKSPKLHRKTENEINSEEKRAEPLRSQDKKKEKIHSKTPKKEITQMNIQLAHKISILNFAIHLNRPKYTKTPNLPQSAPQEKQIEKSHTLEYVPHVTEENVSENNDIFKILQNCYTVANNELGFIAVTYNWAERYLKLEQGLNLLANCKNCDCGNYIQGVVCPRGMFRDRNGYCPLDMELYKVKCPTCKQRITPDESFGFGFYDCDFQITYKLVGQKEYKMRQEGRCNMFYFRKLSILANFFEYLEAQISICTFV